MNNEEKWHIDYKIEPYYKGNPVRYSVFRTEYNGIWYYKIRMGQKNFDGTRSNYYKNVRFRKGCEPKIFNDNRVDIYIKYAFENLSENKNDKYNPISTLVIMDYEVLRSEEEEQKEAKEIFRDDVFGNNDNNFNLEDGMEIDDNSLPF